MLQKQRLDVDLYRRITIIIVLTQTSRENLKTYRKPETREREQQTADRPRRLELVPGPGLIPARAAALGACS